MNRKPIHLGQAIRLALLCVPLTAGTAIAQDGGMIEEVTVTARKTTESLQTVPVNVTAVSSEMIRNLNIQSLEDISKVTAGLVFDSEFGRGANRPVIRGQANILGDSGVSYFIDGVYITGSIDDYDINDVERIEVVKGPQSALYGRNTYSGAINIITKSPGDEFSARGQIEVAEDGQYEVTGNVKGPMTDTLSGGLTARYFNLDGPFTNTFDGSDIGDQESKSLSGVLVYEPSDNLTVRARAYYAETEDGQPAIFASRTADNNCFIDNGALYGGRGRYFCGTVEPGPINTDYPVQAPGAGFDAETLNFSLNIDYDINDAWSFTSVTGINSRDEDTLTDGDYQPTSFQVANFTPGGFPFAGFEDGPPFLYGYVGSISDFTFANASEIDDFSQEFRFNYEGDGIRALFGVYYFDQDDDTRDTRVLPPGAEAIAIANFSAELSAQQQICSFNPVCESIVPFFGPGITVPRDQNNLDITNTAIYGLVGFDLDDAWTLTIEARYQEEDIDRVARVMDLGDDMAVETVSSASFDSFSPRVTVDWQATENNMFYALYAEGTKPGGFNSTVAVEAGLPTFDEEDVQSFEIGSKNVFANNSWTANFSLFFNEVEGYQLTQNVQAGANATSATVNAGDVDITGFEAELAGRPTDEISLSFNYAWVDTEFQRGVDQNQGVLNDVADDGLVNCSIGDQFPDVDGCTSLFGSIVGNEIPRTAEHQFFADAEYRTAMQSFNGWDWYVGLNASYESSKFAQVHNLAETGSTTLVNARIGWENPNYSIQLWGRNLTGEDTAPAVLRYAEPTAFTRNFAVSPRRDTYWGITATAFFD
ncbi:MAG: TonB-dependent receptor [Pseudomonadota bacterium]